MKDLTEYIDYRYRFEIDNCRSNLEDYFGDYLNEEIKRRFDENPLFFQELIEENLQSHDINILHNALKKNFDNNIINIEKRSDNNITSAILKTPVLFYIDNRNEFEYILEFFNYYVTGTTVKDNYRYIYIEPLYSTDKTEYIQDNCHYTIYHIMNVKDLDSIKIIYKKHAWSKVL